MHASLDLRLAFGMAGRAGKARLATRNKGTRSGTSRRRNRRMPPRCRRSNTRRKYQYWYREAEVGKVAGTASAHHGCRTIVSLSGGVQKIVKHGCGDFGAGSAGSGLARVVGNETNVFSAGSQRTAIAPAGTRVVRIIHQLVFVYSICAKPRTSI